MSHVGTRQPATRLDTIVAVALVSEQLPRDHMLRTTCLYHGFDLRLLIMANFTDAISSRQQVNNFVSKRVALLLAFLERCDDKQVVLYTDAYDVFFLQPAALTLKRFRAFNADVVWSVERMFSGQDILEKPHFDALAGQRSVARNKAESKYRYINSGGFIGIASTLRRLVADAMSIRPGATGWHNKTCGEARGRHCADQWIFGKVISGSPSGGGGLGRFNISLDYDRSIFCTSEAFKPTTPSCCACPSSENCP